MLTVLHGSFWPYQWTSIVRLTFYIQSLAKFGHPEIISIAYEAVFRW